MSRSAIPIHLVPLSRTGKVQIVRVSNPSGEPFTGALSLELDKVGGPLEVNAPVILAAGQTAADVAVPLRDEFDETKGFLMQLRAKGNADIVASEAAPAYQQIDDFAGPAIRFRTQFVGNAKVKPRQHFALPSLNQGRSPRAYARWSCLMVLMADTST